MCYAAGESGSRFPTILYQISHWKILGWMDDQMSFILLVQQKHHRVVHNTIRLKHNVMPEVIKLLLISVSKNSVKLIYSVGIVSGNINLCQLW